jgi:AcrR family transcriptional regulator
MNTMIEKLNVRGRLLETAMRLFHERGYLATGVNEIIKQAGISKASFYHHFRTKEDLLIVALEQRHEQQMASIRTASMQGNTPAQKIEQVFKWLGVSSLGQGCAFLNAMSEFRGAGSRVLDLVRWHKAAKRQFFGELVAAHFRSSGKSEQEIQSVADEVYLLAQAILAATPVHAGNWTVDTAWRLAASRLGLH